MTTPLLEVAGLTTVFHTEDGTLTAIDDVSLTVAPGEIVGLVGESGSGKSVTGFSIMGLVDRPGEIVAGAVRFRGEDLVTKSEAELRRLRGSAISMIFQDPLMTLNPVLRIDTQMIEAVREHEDVSRGEALRRCAAALERVGIASASDRLRSYPHEFSGGMRQRVAIAIAMINRPDLIIADEPTTALDVTIQGQILAEMQSLCEETGTALIWITHDLGVIAGLAQRIAVMYAGRIVESGTVDGVLDAPRHPYTMGLIQSVPSEDVRGRRLAQIEGSAPPLSARPSGCAFHPRCTRRLPVCSRTWPEPTVAPDGHLFLCHNPIPA
ncbi:ABC transporter ATP-binding protein [Acuticoccus sp.]|uniref:ABC transporter ATP-binding protein n=1 Tax=Acuticoccus sp. TaxID=1904378 RepID=UPI003B518DD4